LNDAGLYSIRTKRIGIPDSYVEQGPQAQLRKDVGIDKDGILLAAKSLINK
jgi:1-deoxy-D-xylulose-5-phosphate synthase